MKGKELQCVNCNERRATEICTTCGKETDQYQNTELGIAIVDLVLGRLEAYRHVILNAQRSPSKRFLFRLVALVLFLEIVFGVRRESPLYTECWLDIGQSNQCVPEDGFSAVFGVRRDPEMRCSLSQTETRIFLAQGVRVISVLAFEALAYFAATFIVYRKKLTCFGEEGATVGTGALARGFILSQFPRAAVLCALVWPFKPFFSIAVSIGRFLATFCTFRALFEKQAWLLPMTALLLGRLLTSLGDNLLGSLGVN
eukprot:TRINITY_DN4191_c0_g1_i1.p1 TRINITY_DN4191_c0_g1~~TRINITY_DN4191_c0_g1_i1.p1  ORF type:complete len:256 (-),score=42.07 TRINITY_DN4191_c0_g1_i1:450-1217(-)